MFRSLKSIFGYSIQATDDDIGKISNAYFDDEKWIIRYLVVDTGSWLVGKQVLLSPVAFVPPNAKPDWSTQTVPVFLTQQQIKEAPAEYTEQTVSRKNEMDLANYYHWPNYWNNDPFLTQNVPYTIPLIKAREESKSENHLRSSKEVLGYHIHGTDGDIGHVEDIIFDDESWHIMYFVVNTRNILPDKKVLLPLLWVKEISWAQSNVKVDLTCQSIKDGPVYNPEESVNRETEEVLYDYYGRPKYWINT